MIWLEENRKYSSSRFVVWNNDVIIVYAHSWRRSGVPIKEFFPSPTDPADEPR